MSDPFWVEGAAQETFHFTHAQAALKYVLQFFSALFFRLIIDYIYPPVLSFFIQIHVS